MLSDNNINFDANASFEDSNYKSCFARSVVVNSQYQNLKISNNNQQQLQKEDNSDRVHTNKGEPMIKPTPYFPVVGKLRRDSFLSDSRRSSSISDSRRSSACSSRIAEMPVENLLLKSQIETLEWQLKQTEASKEMYRAVMTQVVKFLERAHQSLQLLGSKLNNTNQQIVPRAQSDYHMLCIKENTLDGTASPRSIDSSTDYTAFRDFTWRRQKKPQPSSEEIPLEKLSQEAFRLLRTAQSLLNTRAPDLAHVNTDNSQDLQFLEELAKEFPRLKENGTHKPDSNCTRLQTPTPKEDIRISTALNRKLSLQRNGEFKRNSFHTSSPKIVKPLDLFSMENGPGNIDLNSDCGSSIISYKSIASSEKDKIRSFKLEPEKSNSPPVSSMSSAEDESGFSSMNSFQELGIPLLHPVEEKTTKEALLKSMLQDNELSKDLKKFNGEDSERERAMEAKVLKSKDLKLWERPTSHKRWNSMPVQNNSSVTEKQPLKVLWV